MNDLDKKMFDSLKLEPLVIRLLYFAGIIILFSIFSPLIFTQSTLFSEFDFTETGEIGDTIGGIMNPIITLSGVILTFLAFYIQYKANQTQYLLFKIEFNEQKTQRKKDKVENQFYEMLRLHKENVNDVSIEFSEKNIIRGRKTFELFLDELELLIELTVKFFPEIKNNNKKLINEAYGIFFHGLPTNLDQHEFFMKLKNVQFKHAFEGYQNLNINLKEITNVFWEKNIPIPLFEGYSAQIAHYYRHLFQTVKYITKQDDAILTYEEKRNYLRILRAQLSNQEQAMLFYNWFSDFGKQWEGKENNFLTDYRMIHNIYPSLFHKTIDLTKIEEFNRDLKKENDEDLLFEYMD